MTPPEPLPELPPDIRASDPTTWIGGLVAVSILAITLGPVGVLAGGALALAWYLVPVVYVVAIGHVLIAGIWPEHASFTRLALIELGFISMLAGTAHRVDHPIRFFLTFSVTILALGGIAIWLTQQRTPLWELVVILAVIILISSYSIHRYERVRLGLVKEAPE